MLVYRGVSLTFFLYCEDKEILEEERCQNFHYLRSRHVGIKKASLA